MLEFSLFFLALCYYHTISYSEYIEIPTFESRSYNPEIDVMIGNPPLQKLMLYDTGSFHTNLACGPCAFDSNDCDKYRGGPDFFPSLSSTYKTIPCSDPACSCIAGYISQCHSCMYDDSNLLHKAILKHHDPHLKATDIVSNVNEVEQIIEGAFSKVRNPYKHKNVDLLSKSRIKSNTSLSEDLTSTPQRKLSTEGTCSFDIVYLDNTHVSGPFFEEILMLMDNSETPFNHKMLGCDFSNYDTLNGIIGAALYSFDVNDMLYQSYLKNKDLPNFVGICSAEVQTGGIISFGGYNPDYLITNDITWTDLMYDLHVSFHVDSIQVGDYLYKHSVYYVYDSGASYSLLPKYIVDHLDSIFEDACSKSRSCTSMTTEGVKVFIRLDLDKLPDTKITFFNKDGQFIHFTITDFFWEVYSQIIMLTYQALAISDEADYAIIGSMNTRNKFVLMDNTNHKIAFPNANCPNSPFNERVVLYPEQDPVNIITNLPDETVHYDNYQETGSGVDEFIYADKPTAQAIGSPEIIYLPDAPPPNPPDEDPKPPSTPVEDPPETQTPPSESDTNIVIYVIVGVIVVVAVVCAITIIIRLQGKKKALRSNFV